MFTDSTVYLVDDDASVLDSLSVLLTTLGLRVRPCDSGKAFLDIFVPGAKACLVLDIRMPNMSGLELMEILRQRHATIPCIVMTAHGDIKMAVRAMKLGAVDFIEKPFTEQQIVESIRSALEQDEIARTTEDDAARFRDHVALLTERELEVFRELIKGNLNKVIAAELGISPRTVEIHRARVLEKLQVRNLSQLIKLSLQAGFG